jgi:hypothetical protein
MQGALRILVVAIALPEAGLIGFFALGSLSGDSWGIMRAMALLLGAPFLLFTVPALVLARRDRALPLAAGLALLSVAATYLAWRFA